MTSSSMIGVKSTYTSAIENKEVVRETYAVASRSKNTDTVNEHPQYARII